MQTELDSVTQIAQGYSITGTVNGHRVAVDLPTTYVDSMPREAGREYMRKCLEKVFCAQLGIDYNGR